MIAIGDKTYRNVAGLPGGGVLLGQNVALDVSPAADLLAELSMDGRVSALLDLVDHGVRAVDGRTDIDCIVCEGRRQLCRTGGKRLTLLQGMNVRLQSLALVVRVDNERRAAEVRCHGVCC